MGDWTYPCCPSCHHDKFHLREDRAGTLQVVCAGCGRLYLEQGEEPR